MKVSASKIWNELNHTRIVASREKQMHLPCCYRWCLIELMKKWMGVMHYEGECIETMECVKSYENCGKLKQTNELNLMFPTMLYWIGEKMNDIDDVWRWVHQNYGMSWIVQKLL